MAKGNNRQQKEKKKPKKAKYCPGGLDKTSKVWYITTYEQKTA